MGKERITVDGNLAKNMEITKKRLNLTLRFIADSSQAE